MSAEFLPARLRDWMDSQKWIYAKTMPNAHHFYLCEKTMGEEDSRCFFDVVRLVREFGYVGKWYRIKLIYLEIGERFKIWTMGAPIEETYILNIADKDSSPSKNIYIDPNQGIFSPRRASSLT